jgi:hypothetical protein
MTVIQQQPQRQLFYHLGALLVVWMLVTHGGPLVKTILPTAPQSLGQRRRDGSHTILQKNTTTLSNSSGTASDSKESAFVADKLVPAPSHSIEYQNMDAMCTLKRYTYLFAMFCDPTDRSICDLDAFKAYFKNHNATENLTGGCPLTEALCYAKRHPDLYRGYCSNNDTKCDYYALRHHYEHHGMRERRVWGCDLQPIVPATTVSRKQPAITTNTLPISTKRVNVLGKASLQVFQGTWEPVKYEQPSESICPETTRTFNRFCNYTTRPADYFPAKYVANGLPRWSAQHFKAAMTKHGDKIGFVGDSLMYQLISEFRCLAQAENVYLPNLNYYQVFMSSLPESIHEHFQMRGRECGDLRTNAFSLNWVHRAISDKVTYVVYNTGAWWNSRTFLARGNWCDYNHWRQATLEETLRIYTEVWEQTLLPIFTSLVRDHGIIPIWLDTTPAGKINLTTGENHDDNRWVFYYPLFPRFNEIGRRMMVQAGGLVLPTWDASFPRSMDHLFNHLGGDDQLHWCAQHHRSVISVWAQLLSQVLYGNEEEEIKATNNTESNTEHKQRGLRSLLPLQQGHEDLAEETRRRAQDLEVLSHSSLQDIFSFDSQNPPRSRVLVGENPVTSSEYVAVPLSRSITSSCECGRAKDKFQCIANIRCSWRNSTEESAEAVCSEAAA